jgi:alkylresorcinol/alkylpyrone synthase
MSRITDPAATPVTVLGIGKAVPPHRICQSETAELAKSLSCCSEKHERVLAALYQRTRVHHRASVFANGIDNGAVSFQSFFPSIKKNTDKGPWTEDRMHRYAAEAPALAIQASKDAISDAGIHVDDIGQIVTVSCTGFSAPGFDISLMKELGLRNSVNRTHIGFMGCHGVFNALRVASALARENPKKMVLVCSVELCTIHFAYGWDPDRVLANALFADGSSAAVIASGPEHRNRWTLGATGSYLFPDSDKAMTWRVGNHGFEMGLSAKVPGLLATHLRPWITQWLKEQGLTVKGIKSWAIHPGGPRVLDSVVSSLKLPSHAALVSRKILADYGNMSSATVLFILDHLYKESAPRPCVALGFGPGLVAESALFL